MFLPSIPFTSDIAATHNYLGYNKHNTLGHNNNIASTDSYSFFASNKTSAMPTPEKPET